MSTVAPSANQNSQKTIIPFDKHQTNAYHSLVIQNKTVSYLNVVSGTHVPIPALTKQIELFNQPSKFRFIGNPKSYQHFWTIAQQSEKKYLLTFFWRQKQTEIFKSTGYTLQFPLTYSDPNSQPPVQKIAEHDSLDLSTAQCVVTSFGETSSTLWFTTLKGIVAIPAHTGLISSFKYYGCSSQDFSIGNDFAMVSIQASCDQTSSEDDVPTHYCSVLVTGTMVKPKQQVDSYQKGFLHGAALKEDNDSIIHLGIAINSSSPLDDPIPAPPVDAALNQTSNLIINDSPVVPPDTLPVKAQMKDKNLTMQPLGAGPHWELPNSNLRSSSDPSNPLEHFQIIGIRRIQFSMIQTSIQILPDPQDIDSLIDVAIVSPTYKVLSDDWDLFQSNPNPVKQNQPCVTTQTPSYFFPRAVATPNGFDFFASVYLFHLPQLSFFEDYKGNYPFYQPRNFLVKFNVSNKARPLSVSKAFFLPKIICQLSSPLPKPHNAIIKSELPHMLEFYLFLKSDQSHSLPTPHLSEQGSSTLLHLKVQDNNSDDLNTLELSSLASNPIILPKPVDFIVWTSPLTCATLQGELLFLSSQNPYQNLALDASMSQLPVEIRDIFEPTTVALSSPTLINLMGSLVRSISPGISDSSLIVTDNNKNKLLYQISNSFVQKLDPLRRYVGTRNFIVASWDGKNMFPNIPNCSYSVPFSFQIDDFIIATSYSENPFFPYCVWYADKSSIHAFTFLASKYVELTAPFHVVSMSTITHATSVVASGASESSVLSKSEASQVSATPNAQIIPFCHHVYPHSAISCRKINNSVSLEAFSLNHVSNQLKSFAHCFIDLSSYFIGIEDFLESIVISNLVINNNSQLRLVIAFTCSSAAQLHQVKLKNADQLPKQLKNIFINQKVDDSQETPTKFTFFCNFDIKIVTNKLNCSFKVVLSDLISIENFSACSVTIPNRIADSKIVSFDVYNYGIVFSSDKLYSEFTPLPCLSQRVFFNSPHFALAGLAKYPIKIFKSFSWPFDQYKHRNPTVAHQGLLFFAPNTCQIVQTGQDDQSIGALENSSTLDPNSPNSRITSSLVLMDSKRLSLKICIDSQITSQNVMSYFPLQDMRYKSAYSGVSSSPWSFSTSFAETTPIFKSFYNPKLLESSLGHINDALISHTHQDYSLPTANDVSFENFDDPLDNFFNCHSVNQPFTIAALPINKTHIQHSSIVKMCNQINSSGTFPIIDTILPPFQGLMGILERARLYTDYVVKSKIWPKTPLTIDIPVQPGPIPENIYFSISTLSQSESSLKTVGYFFPIYQLLTDKQKLFFIKLNTAVVDFMLLANDLQSLSRKKFPLTVDVILCLSRMKSALSDLTKLFATVSWELHDKDESFSTGFLFLLTWILNCPQFDFGLQFQVKEENHFVFTLFMVSGGSICLDFNIKGSGLHYSLSAQISQFIIQTESFPGAIKISLTQNCFKLLKLQLISELQNSLSDFHFLETQYLTYLNAHQQKATGAQFEAYIEYKTVYLNYVKIRNQYSRALTYQKQLTNQLPKTGVWNARMNETDKNMTDFTDKTIQHSQSVLKNHSLLLNHRQNVTDISQKHISLIHSKVSDMIKNTRLKPPPQMGQFEQQLNQLKQKSLNLESKSQELLSIVKSPNNFPKDPRAQNLVKVISANTKIKSDTQAKTKDLSAKITSNQAQSIIATKNWKQALDSVEKLPDLDVVPSVWEDWISHLNLAYGKKIQSLYNTHSSAGSTIGLFESIIADLRHFNPNATFTAVFNPYWDFNRILWEFNDESKPPMNIQTNKMASVFFDQNEQAVVSHQIFPQIIDTLLLNIKQTYFVPQLLPPLYNLKSTISDSLEVGPPANTTSLV